MPDRRQRTGNDFTSYVGSLELGLLRNNMSHLRLTEKWEMLARVISVTHDVICCGHQCKNLTKDGTSTRLYNRQKVRAGNCSMAH